MKKRYPFKFLDAYRKEDIAFFFGREEEIEALYNMVFQTKILVVYGTSGTGKTSLIQCGLASKFQSYDWLSLYVRRGANLIASLDKALCAESDEAFTYTEQDQPAIRDLPKKIEAVYRASFKPIYLIFDQFEELYVLGDKQEQAQFLQTVQNILEIEQPVKIIISVREEYLGHLYEFERAVPELMRKKLRVEPMNLDKVESVIRNVGRQAESNVSLQTGEESEVAEAIFEKIRGKNALTIELPYLQVFLDKLYLHLTRDETRRAEAVFSLASLLEMGDIGDVLRDFLDEQVIAIARALEQQPDTVWEILSPFVTLDGTKEPLSESELCDRRPRTDAALLAKVLKALAHSRILRYSEHDERYEIAHDALARQVAAKRSDEEIALLEVQRLIKSQVALKADKREFFSEKQLGIIEPYLNKYRPDAEERDWIEQSRAHRQAERETAARREREELERVKRQAEEERRLREEAEAQKAAAVEAKKEAEKQKNIALQNEARAKQRTALVGIVSLIALVLAIFGWWNFSEAQSNFKELNEEKIKRDQAEKSAKKTEADKLIQQAEIDIEAGEFWFAQKKLDSASVRVQNDPRVEKLKSKMDSLMQNSN